MSNDIGRSSGDVFEDLGLELSQEEYIKIEIASLITNLIDSEGYTQNEVAKIIGEDQARVSNLVRGRLGRFSVEKLLKILIALGFDIDMHMSRRVDGNQGRVRVLAN